MTNNRDCLILVDTQDHIVGSCTKENTHRKPLLHRAFSVFLIHKNCMLLQKRHPEKYHSGGLWANACCSHPRIGESLEYAVQRRLQEELNTSVPVEELFSFLYFAKFSPELYEYELDHVFLGEISETPRFNPSEISAIRWISFEQLRQEMMINPEQFSVWFLSAAPRVLNYLDKKTKASKIELHPIC